MWDTIWSILIAVLMLGVMLWVHELGHFLTARATGIKVVNFSIGFGPALWKRKKNDVTYALRAFPLGGYVQFYGEDEENLDNPDAFSKQKAWKRMLTVLAGSLTNVLLAILLATAFLTIYGEYLPVIGTVEAGTPAQAAGIQPGDTITSVNGVHVDYNAEAYTELSMAGQKGDASVHLTLKDAQGNEKSADVAFYTDEALQQTRIGISFDPQRVRYSLGEAFLQSFGWVFYLVRQMFMVLGGLFTGATNSASLVGVVGLVETMSTAAKVGMESILRIATLISVNLGLMNLLPIPGLDGSHAVFILIEWIRGKPVDPKWMGRIQFVGLALILCLGVLLIFQDFTRLFTQGSAIPQ